MIVEVLQALVILDYLISRDFKVPLLFLNMETKLHQADKNIISLLRSTGYDAHETITLEEIVNYLRITYNLHAYVYPISNIEDDNIITFESCILWPKMPAKFVADDDDTYTDYEQALIVTVKNALEMVIDTKSGESC